MKVNGYIPSKSRLRKSQAVLEIPNLQLDDAGIYECTAENSRGKNSFRGQLQIYSKCFRKAQNFPPEGEIENANWTEHCLPDTENPSDNWKLRFFGLVSSFRMSLHVEINGIVILCVDDWEFISMKLDLYLVLSTIIW